VWRHRTPGGALSGLDAVSVGADVAAAPTMSSILAANGRKLSYLLGMYLCAASCSQSDDDDDNERASNGGAETRAGSSSSNNSSGSLNLGGSMSSEEPSQAGAGTVGSVDRDDACATSTDATKALPPVVQLVVDTSGSMDWPPGWAPASPDDSKPPGATKWEITRDALLAAVDSLGEDIALGASFFPSVAQEGDTCLLNEEAVPLALLGPAGSDARMAWESAVGEVDPEGATPTHGAYLFGVEQLSGTKLEGAPVILLITDGTPTCTLSCECTEDNVPVDSEPLIAEAAEAFANGVRTFVIGSPGSEETRDVLSKLASEGGTARPGCSNAGPEFCHFDMTTEPDLAKGLADALDEIGMSLGSCEYPIPAPPAGQALDPELVNVLYTPEGADTETIARDPSSDDCTEGWQYSADGERIVLCGEACERVRAEPNGTVEVLFGCETLVSQPK
jgi:Mg-chelatase subunit ChlD